MADKVSPVLIVEDEPQVINFLGEIFKMHKINYQSTDNYPEAVRRLNNQVYLAILLDVRIKNGIGTDVVAQLRANETHCNFKTPIIVTSGHLDRDVIGAVAQKVQGILVKPYSQEKLLACMATALPAHFAGLGAKSSA